MKEAFSLRRNLRALLVPPKDNLAVVDGIRALSIVWLIIFHVFFVLNLYIDPEVYANLLRDTPAYMNWIWNADKAVDGFFVISGFLIAGLLFRENQNTGGINLKTFYVRRFIRLTPVYWFAIVLCYLLTEHNTDMLWTNVLYINNFIPFEKMTMEWTWSLAVEEQFYLVFPLFLLAVFFKSQYKWQWLFGLIVVSCLVRLLVIWLHPGIWNGQFSSILVPTGSLHEYVNSLYVNLHTRFGPFVCGIWAAYGYFYYGDAVRKLVESAWGALLTLVSLFVLLFFALTPVFHPDHTWSQPFQIFYLSANRALFGLSVAWFILVGLHGTLPGRWLKWCFSFRIWYVIAQLSYSMYLFHILVAIFVLFNLKVNMQARGIAVEELSFWGVFSLVLLVIPLSMLVSAVTYLLIERPFMNLRHGYRPALKPDAESSEAEKASASDVTDLADKPLAVGLPAQAKA